MILEKNKIQQIIREHKISSFVNKDENELANILYDTFVALGQIHQEKLATKEDIKMLIQMIDKRFEAVDKRFEDLYKHMDKRFEDMNKKFTMMFTFMNIGFALIVMLTVLFKFLT
jgi:hypothetical protein